MGRVARKLVGDEATYPIRTNGRIHRLLSGLDAEAGFTRQDITHRILDLSFGSRTIEEALVLGLIQRRFSIEEGIYYTLSKYGVKALILLENTQPLLTVKQAQSFPRNSYSSGQVSIPRMYKYVEIPIQINPSWHIYFQQVSW